MGIYDFSDFKAICDIGGGQGAFLLQLLDGYPQIKGIIADMPGAVVSAEKAIAEAGLVDRCQAIYFDFFKDIPPVCDGYFLVNILHDWDDENCRRILNNVSDSMDAGSKLWLVEYLIETGPEFSVAKLLDIEVLVMGSGRERTAEEYKTLLGSAGLKVNSVIPTERGPALMECIQA
jgi:hypothetical protein